MRQQASIPDCSTEQDSGIVFQALVGAVGADRRPDQNCSPGRSKYDPNAAKLPGDVSATRLAGGE